MRKLVISSITIWLALSLTAQGVAACDPVASRRWSGQIQVAKNGGLTGVTRQYFRANDCKWNGGEQLNGFDGLVWDIRGHGGLSVNVFWNSALPTSPTGVSGLFLDGACQNVAFGTFVHDKRGATEKVKVPATARWLIVEALGLNSLGVGLDVRVDSPGRKCGATTAAKRLSLSASPASFKGKKAVRFVVKAGGRPVKGALVKVGGKKKKTSSSGVAKITVGPYSKTKRLRATATKAGYKLASKTITVRRR
jgi:hypothetical protein